MASRTRSLNSPSPYKSGGSGGLLCPAPWSSFHLCVSQCRGFSHLSLHHNYLEACQNRLLGPPAEFAFLTNFQVTWGCWSGNCMGRTTVFGHVPSPWSRSGPMLQLVGRGERMQVWPCEDFKSRPGSVHITYVRSICKNLASGHVLSSICGWGGKRILVGIQYFLPQHKQIKYLKTILENVLRTKNRMKIIPMLRKFDVI